VKSASWYTSKWAVIFYHVLAWLAWFSFPYLLQANFQQPRFVPPPEIIAQLDKLSGRPFRQPPVMKTIMRLSFIQNIVLLVLFYANAFRFVPSLLYKRKIGRYALVIFSLLGVLGYSFYKLHEIITGETRGFRGPHFTFISFFLFIIAVSTSYRIITDKIHSDRLQKEKENANLQTELSFLRSQVSPHFVFNVLNNMVSLARKKSDLLEPSLIRLSSLMRYMLYEANADKVMLSKEIEYLNGYIELQEQRFSNQVKVECTIDCENTTQLIEPMLLIPFVENAFKHGIGIKDKPEIIIRIHEYQGKLELEVKNNFNNCSGENKDKTSGIGLHNVKRRLDLLYGSRHSLFVKNDGEIFLVQMQLNLTNA
jgi:sensor histidine kinase YesM